MENTYYISTNPEFYGSDATEEDAAQAAEIIAARAEEEFPAVKFAIGESVPRFEDEDLLTEVQQFINDNFSDWLS